MACLKKKQELEAKLTEIQGAAKTLSQQLEEAGATLAAMNAMNACRAARRRRRGRDGRREGRR